MARGYGFLGGAVSGLTVVYLTLRQMQTNTALVRSELRQSKLLAENKPVHIRPYTDPINLETREWRDTLVDMWNAEVLRAVHWLYSVGRA